MLKRELVLYRGCMYVWAFRCIRNCSLYVYGFKFKFKTMPKPDKILIGSWLAKPGCLLCSDKIDGAVHQHHFRRGTRARG
eukprot:scaffold14002_cov83-Skeletonema_dohrnii-CCMP3373.AAC.2